MKRVHIAVLAAGFSAMASPSFAADPVRWTSRVELLSHTGCEGVKALGKFPALSTYRPKFSGQGSLPSGLIIRPGRGAAIFLSKEDPDTQLDGQGTWSGAWIGGNVVLRIISNGSYDLTVTPFPINAETKNLTIEGTISNFSKTGCTIEIFGDFSRINKLFQPH